MNVQPILHAILADYELPLSGAHGIVHWARVYENGMRLSAETGANVNVVRLFAILHDSRRQNEHHDPDHGPRAATFARTLHGTVLDLPSDDLELLCVACAGHTHERDHPDVTVQTCWDADRLDLGRVGITPHPSRLCTAVAKRPDIIKWADGRASLWFVPDLVEIGWGVNIAPR